MFNCSSQPQTIYYLATVDHFQICRFPSCLSFENQLGKGTTSDFGTLLGFYALLAASESYTYTSLPKVVISHKLYIYIIVIPCSSAWTPLKNPRIASWRHRLVATPGTKASRFRRLRINETVEMTRHQKNERDAPRGEDAAAGCGWWLVGEVCSFWRILLGAF